MMNKINATIRSGNTKLIISDMIILDPIHLLEIYIPILESNFLTLYLNFIKKMRIMMVGLKLKKKTFLLIY